MNTDVFASLLRQLLTIGGTYLVARGTISPELVGPLTDVIGAVAVGVSTGWSVKTHATPKAR